MIKTISQYFLCSKVSLKLVAVLLHHQYQWLFDLLSRLPKRAAPKSNQASLKIQNPVDVVINNSSVAKGLPIKKIPKNFLWCGHLAR
jgi:hypothetical protein